MLQIIKEKKKSKLIIILKKLLIKILYILNLLYFYYLRDVVVKQEPTKVRKERKAPGERVRGRGKNQTVVSL